eukprot:TCONS_00051474-protein
MLNSLLKTLSQDKRYSHKCFVGDFNLPTINWESWTSPHIEDSKEEKFLDALRNSFLYQHVKESTRCRGMDEPSLVDLILTSEYNQINNLKYLSPLGLGDHSVPVFDFKCRAEQKPSCQKYAYSSADFQEMRYFLEAEKWTQNFIAKSNDKTVCELWEHFKGDLTDLRNRFVPLKEVGNSYWKCKGIVPLGEEIRNEIRTKKRLHRKWVNSSDAEKVFNRTQYVSSRNRVNSMIRQVRRSYEPNISRSAKNNPKRFWSHVRNQLKSTSRVTSLLESEDDKKSIKHEDVEKANILQKQFCSVFTHEPEGELPPFEKKTESMINILEVSQETVIKQIKQLDANKSFGPDELHPSMLKELIDFVAEPLKIIMNKTLEESVLPEDWKMAHVTPIYKNKGAHNLVINYRPVSLTSIICKMMESVLRKVMIDHLVRENLLSDK